MTELRWILLSIGLAAFAAIYLHGRWQARRGTRRDRHEPKLASAATGQARGKTTVSAKTAPGAGPESIPNVEKLVTLYVEAQPDGSFSGGEIFASAKRVGLEFGQDGLFHRITESEAKRVYSLANMVNPGTFDQREKDTLKTPGVSFFLGLPGPMTAVEAFDAMLAAAQRVADVLDGDVRDEQHCRLSRQRILHLREEMRSYDRSQRKPPSFSRR